jgi:hypothetical protein
MKVMMYGTGDVAAASYYPTETEKGTIAEDPAVPSDATTA